MPKNEVKAGVVEINLKMERKGQGYDMQTNLWICAGNLPVICVPVMQAGTADSLDKLGIPEL